MPAVVPASIDAKGGDQVVICINLAPTLQRLTDCLKNGYSHVATGLKPVPHSKAGPLLAKWIKRYPMLTKSKHAGTRAAKAGHARYKVVMFWNKIQGHALMYLLTDRPEQDQHREQWQCVTGGRVERLALYQYEAIRATKPEQPEPSWTWQIRKEYFDRFRRFVQMNARRQRFKRLASFEQMARTWPGFHRVRRQHSELGGVLQAEWLGEGRPKWKTLGYVQRLKTRRG